MNIGETHRAIRDQTTDMVSRHKDGEWRVTIGADKVFYRQGGTYREAVAKSEAMACYETDGDAALGTALAMQATWDKQA